MLVEDFFVAATFGGFGVVVATFGGFDVAVAVGGFVVEVSCLWICCHSCILRVNCWRLHWNFLLMSTLPLS